MWNNTDEPLAYLITFRAYGTWLHGDERHSVDRHNNTYGSSKIEPNSRWESYNREQLKQPPVELNAARRRSIMHAVRETCEIRRWMLYALNVRTNHAHSVIHAPNSSPGIVLSALKANATRQMRQDGCWTSEGSPWVEKGSKRRLWNEPSLERAVHYVLFWTRR
jgi:REP element-mobilizing transposase RayT